MKIKQEVIQELKLLIGWLEQNQIDYFISGSLALNSYMVSRFTRDVDIVISLSEKSSEIFFDYFKDNFYLNRQEALKQILNSGFFNALSLATGYKYDFILKNNAPYEQIKFERKQRMQIFDVPAWIISLEDLIVSKLQWMQQSESVMQQNDIQALLEDTKPDMAYIKFWLRQLKLNTFGLIK